MCLQFLAVGGATDKSKFSVPVLQAALDQVEAVKAAGEPNSGAGPHPHPLTLTLTSTLTLALTLTRV